jgi:hypothetical protein
VIVVSSDRSSNKSWQERCFVDNHAQIPCPYSSKRAAHSIRRTPINIRNPHPCRYYTEVRTLCRHPGSLPGPVSVSWWRTCSIRSLLLSLRKRSRGHGTLSFTIPKSNRRSECHPITSDQTVAQSHIEVEMWRCWWESRIARRDLSRDAIAACPSNLDLALVHRVGSRPCGFVFTAISFLDSVRCRPFRYGTKIHIFKSSAK